MSDQSNAEAVIETVRRLSGVEVIDISRGNFAECQVVVLPEGKNVYSLKEHLDEYLPVPQRKAGMASLTQLDAFVAYVNRHKTAQSVVFLDDRVPTQIKMHAVFNPHGSGETDPGYADFGAVYPFPMSEEWKSWTGSKELSQAGFAAFLEDHIADVLDPSVAGEKTKRVSADLGIQFAGPAKLMELSRGLSISVDQRVAQHVNTNTGEGRLVFSEEHRDASGAPLAVPGGFAIGIPVFRLGPAYQVAVRLRYRVTSEKKVAWVMTLHGVDRVLEHAIGEAEAKVHTETGLPVFRGASSVGG